MKKAIIRIFLSTLLVVETRAQNESPDALLLEAMKGVYSFTQEEAQAQDYKKYFLSDRFQSDSKSGKWNMGLNVLIDGKPFGLSAGAADQEIKAFQEKIQEASKVSFSSAGSIKIATRILDPQVLAKYVELVKARQINFNTSIEDNGTIVTFKVSFRKESDDVPWPVIRSLAVDGGILLENQNRVGKQISAPIVLRTRRDDDSEVILTLETSNSPVILRAAPPKSKLLTNALPIGSVIASVLPFESFLKAVGDAMPYDSKTSSWAPADGRSVASDEYVRLTNTNQVPDLRGKFIRGLNRFDNFEPFPVQNERADPESDRKVMSYQEDAFEMHSHFLTFSDTGNVNRQNGAFGTASQGPKNPHTTNEAGKASETRPKNIALFFYIKIR